MHTGCVRIRFVASVLPAPLSPEMMMDLNNSQGSCLCLVGNVEERMRAINSEDCWDLLLNSLGTGDKGPDWQSSLFKQALNVPYNPHITPI